MQHVLLGSERANVLVAKIREGPNDYEELDVDIGAGVYRGHCRAPGQGLKVPRGDLYLGAFVPRQGSLHFSVSAHTTC